MISVYSVFIHVYSVAKPSRIVIQGLNYMLLLLILITAKRYIFSTKRLQDLMLNIRLFLKDEH